jgi:hypothetical protein
VQRSFYTEQAFTERLIHTEVPTQRSFSRANFYTEKLYTEKLLRRESVSSAPTAEHHSSPCCSHYNRIYDSQLQKTKVLLRTQPQQREAFMQPFHCDLQTLSCKTRKNYAQRQQKLQLQNAISTPKRKKTTLEHF